MSTQPEALTALTNLVEAHAQVAKAIAGRTDPHQHGTDATGALTTILERLTALIIALGDHYIRFGSEELPKGTRLGKAGITLEDLEEANPSPAADPVAVLNELLTPEAGSGAAQNTEAGGSDMSELIVVPKVAADDPLAAIEVTSFDSRILYTRGDPHPTDADLELDTIDVFLTDGLLIALIGRLARSLDFFANQWQLGYDRATGHLWASVKGLRITELPEDGAPALEATLRGIIDEELGR